MATEGRDKHARKDQGRGRGVRERAEGRVRKALNFAGSRKCKRVF